MIFRMPPFRRSCAGWVFARSFFYHLNVKEKGPAAEQPGLNQSLKKRLVALNAHRNAHAAADAQRSEAFLRVAALHLEQERVQHAAARRANREALGRREGDTTILARRQRRNLGRGNDDPPHGIVRQNGSF